MATLTRTSGSDDPLDRNAIANALRGLRLDRITSIKFEIRPSVGIVAKDIDRLGIDIRSFKEPLTRAVKQVVIPSIKKNFAQGGRPAWEPLAEGTIKRRGYSAWPMLKVSGTLQKRATQFNIWDIGLTSATVRSLPEDAFYGVYHQAGSSGTLASQLLKTRPGSKEHLAIINKARKQAKKELTRDIGKVPVGLGTGISEERINQRAKGIIMESEQGWSLPARPFILWQDEDGDKVQNVFLDWMVERARKVGRFVDGA